MTEDGRIEAELQKGDDRLTLRFKDEDDLKAKDPDLHRKYVEMREELRKSD